MGIAVFAVLAVLGVLIVWGISIYNRLVKLSNMRDEAWSGMDVPDLGSNAWDTFCIHETAAAVKNTPVTRKNRTCAGGFSDFCVCDSRVDLFQGDLCCTGMHNAAEDYWETGFTDYARACEMLSHG